MTVRIVLTGIVAGLILGFLGAWLVRRYGFQLGFLDHPNVRSSHSQETPKGAGLGLLLAFIFLSNLFGVTPSIWIPASSLSLLSFLGDRTDISVKLRLAVQVSAALILSWQLIFVQRGDAGIAPLVQALEIIFCVLFITAVSNIYNFMDGINGIAGLTGLIAFAFLAYQGWLSGEEPRFIGLALGLASACLGFLPWNFPRARVFMGDVGSILLGFMFAVLAIKWSRTVADLLMCSFFLFPFFADEGLTLLARLKRGDRLTQAHRRHIYQILVNQMGRPHWEVALVYAVIQIVASVSAIILRPFGWFAVALLLVILLVPFWMVDVVVRRREST